MDKMGRKWRWAYTTKKATLKINRTFIRFATEDKDKHQCLTNADYPYIVFRDCKTVPDMNVVKDTQKLFQVQGYMTPISEGKWNLHS